MSKKTDLPVSSEKEESAIVLDEQEQNPGWVRMKKEDLDNLIVTLSNEGHSPARIGLILRDKHGVPKTRLFGKKITEILTERSVTFRTEKNILDDHISTLKKHISSNKKDHCASRSLTKKLWVLHKIEKH